MDEFIKHIQDSFKQRYETSVITSVKNNDVEYTGLLFRTDNRLVSPVVYMEGYYDDYMHGIPLASIIDKIDNEVRKAGLKRPFDPDLLLEFDKIKDLIRIRVVNHGWNLRYLKEMACRKICDLAVIYALDMDGYFAETEAGRPVVRIREKELALWEITERDLYHTAIENLKKNSDFIVTPLDDFLPVVFNNQSATERCPLYVVTDASGTYPGSAALADVDILERFSGILGGSYLILPSSVHEILLMPLGHDDDTDGLNGIIRKVNGTAVRREEQLSDHLYIFDADHRELRVIERKEKQNGTETK